MKFVACIIWNKYNSCRYCLRANVCSLFNQVCQLFSINIASMLILVKFTWYSYLHSSTNCKHFRAFFNVWSLLQYRVLGNTETCTKAHQNIKNNWRLCTVHNTSHEQWNISVSRENVCGLCLNANSCTAYDSSTRWKVFFTCPTFLHCCNGVFTAFECVYSSIIPSFPDFKQLLI